ncbi:MAG TPA: SH3 domain-containing protein, partial [Candidatus Obscuribacterales bacterium]
MNKILGWTALGIGICGATSWQAITMAASPLSLAYPPNNHETTADRIFLIGTAPPTGEVLVNDRPVQRSAAGHFAPTFPLQVGENVFTLRYQDQVIQLKVTRQAVQSEIPTGLNFGKDSLTPAVGIARLPGETICFGAIAPPQAQVSVKLGDQRIPLQAQTQAVNLPENSAVLTQQNQPTIGSAIGQYQGCTTATTPGSLGQPQFQLSLKGASTAQAAPGKVTILAPNQLEVAEITAEAGTARTGASTDHSRLTPLPKGTRAAITGREGDWLRLDYGAWINQKETRLVQSIVPPRSLIRSLSSRQVPGWTEIVFPLQAPVPVAVQQGDRTFTLNLYNTTAQTDTIYV